MNVIYKEESQRARSAELLVAFLVLVAIGFIIFTTYRSIQGHTILLAEYFIELATIMVLVKNAVSSYTYILTDSAFVIEEKSVFRKRHFEVPYELIDGVYQFRQEFMGQLQFRYKYRKCSTSDPRPVYAMAYAIINGNKVKHGRCLLKAEDAFFEELEKHVPGRVRVPQEEVVFYAVVRKDAVKHGEDVNTYINSMKGEE